MHTYTRICICCPVQATLFVAIVYGSMTVGQHWLAGWLANGIYDCGNIRRQHLSPAALPIETEMRTQRSGNLITSSNLATSGEGPSASATYLCGHLTDHTRPRPRPREPPSSFSQSQRPLHPTFLPTIVVFIDKWPFHMWNGNSIDFCATFYLCVCINVCVCTHSCTSVCNWNENSSNMFAQAASQQ